jgi:hypothetical protein
VSKNPPFVPRSISGARFVPSGFVIVTFVEQHGELPIETPLMRKLIRCPAWPSKKSHAFSPGECVDTVTAGPPGAMS